MGAEFIGVVFVRNMVLLWKSLKSLMINFSLTIIIMFDLNFTVGKEAVSVGIFKIVMQK